VRDEKERLQDILESVTRIEHHADQGKQQFEKSSLIQDGICYQLLIIGESVRNLPPELRQQYCRVPWSAIIGMRNILVHEYFAIDMEIVWSVVEQNLPNLKYEIEKILYRPSEL